MNYTNYYIKNKTKSLVYVEHLPQIISLLLRTFLKAPVKTVTPSGASQNEQSRAFLVNEGVVGLSLGVEFHDVLDQLHVLFVKYLFYLVFCLGKLDVSDKIVLLL